MGFMEKLYDAEKIQSVYGKSFDYNSNSEELQLLKCCLIITHRCTLKCKLCAERTPYYKEKYHPDIEYLKNEIDAYFEMIEYTMKFDVSGGEPFVRKDLADILQYLMKYKDKFGRLRINTNGTILPSQELVEIFKEYGKQIDILIDNYGADLSRNAIAFSERLKENNIRHILRNQTKDTLHYGGWIDFGNLTRKHSLEEAQDLFKKCAITSKIGFGFRIKEGLMSPCAVAIQCMEFNVLPDQPDEYLSLMNGDMTTSEKKDKLMKIFSIKNFAACMYCNGMCEDSKRFAPAEQI